MFLRSALALLLAMPGVARADVFTISYGKPRAEAAPDAGFGSVQGTEGFDWLAAGAYGTVAPFKTSFGTSGMLGGLYSGAMGILGADQYGGVGGRGNYLATFGGDGYTLALSHGAAIPGFNQFGLAISALDGGNRLDFLRAGQVVFSYTPDLLIKALGACGGNAYCGNPATGANGGEQYAFVSFLDRSGYFDQVWFHQSGGGGFETDNHTAGYSAPSAAQPALTALDVPEPHTVALLGAGLMAMGVARRWRRNPAPG